MRTGLSGSVSSLDAPDASDGAPAGTASWRRRGPFTKPMRYPAARAAAVAALLAGLAMTLFTLSRGPQARPLAHDCGLVTCGASLPSPVLGTAVPRTAAHSTAAALRHARPPGLAPAVHRRARPAAPRTAPPARPRAAASATPSPGSWARHRHRHHHRQAD